jgi:hypothetical protein
MTANFHFEELGALFPLTPTLSLGEREKLSQLPGEMMAGFCSTTFAFLATALRSLLTIYDAAK